MKQLKNAISKSLDRLMVAVFMVIAAWPEIAVVMILTIVATLAGLRLV